MSLLKTLLAGLAGAAALTLLHESARHIVPAAPRIDVIGQRALAKPLRKMGYRPSSASRLYTLALLGDLLSNSLYYALIPTSPRPWRRALTLGLLAGVGAVALPPALGLGPPPDRRSPATESMTILWYLTGALAAAATARLLTRPPAPRPAITSEPPLPAHPEAATLPDYLAPAQSGPRSATY